MVARHLCVETPVTEALRLIFFFLSNIQAPKWQSFLAQKQSIVPIQAICSYMWACTGAAWSLMDTCNSECKSEHVVLDRKKTLLKPSSVQRALFNSWKFEWIQTLGFWFILQNRTGFCLYFCFLCQSCKADGFQTTEIVHGRCLMKIPDWNMILIMEKEKNSPNMIIPVVREKRGKGIVLLEVCFEFYIALWYGCIHWG